MSDANELELGRAAPTIPVSDIHRAERFYAELFGFERTFQNGDPVGFMVLEKDAAEVHLTLARGHTGRTFNVMHLMVGDVDVLYRRCVRMGVRVIKGIRDVPWDQRSFVLADPDGNRIDVGQRR